MPIIERDGKIEMDFNKKATVLDLKDVQQSLRILIQLIENLDRRLQTLERS